MDHIVMKSVIKFEHVEHTADAAIRAYGNTLEELFAHAAEGMFAMALPEFPETGNQWRSLVVESNSMEELLVSFLNELNYMLITERRLLFPFKELQIGENDQTCHLSCRAQETEISAMLLGKMQEIKAVTYHQLKIQNKDNRFITTIVFDL